MDSKNQGDISECPKKQYEYNGHLYHAWNPQFYGNDAPNIVHVSNLYLNLNNIYIIINYSYYIINYRQ